MTETVRQTHEFKTEVQQLLKLIINSIYSNKTIFLRELISNASDALDRLRFKAQTDPDILEDDGELKIRLEVDAKNRTLTVSDNGIGMTREEVMENIGTIAKSGTAAFREAVNQAGKNGSSTSELIGQFGVGFYSAFIVADKVTLITQAAGSDAAVRWESAGDGAYTIEPAIREKRGTTVILHLKEPEDGEPDFTQTWTLREVVKKHSDFVAYPIVMDVEIQEPVPDSERLTGPDGKPVGEKTRTVVREETLNSMKAIWAKDKKEISDEAYREFYQHISHDWNEPLAHVHMKFEGAAEYDALLYIPAKAPWDLFHPNRKHGVQLYSRRVFIMEDCKDLIPEYLGFVRGVVDAPDLNLNVSREILQQDSLVRNIQKNLVKKILELLAGMEPEKYLKFYGEFGQILKMGVYTDAANRDKLADLMRFKTTRSQEKPVSLKEYVSGMKPDQKKIYYLTGDNPAALARSPHLEKLREKDFEVLLMTDPVDEWVVQALTEYDGKPLASVGKGDLGLEEKAADEKAVDFSNLLGFIKNQLGDRVKDVKPSARLTQSMSCLAADADDMSPFMEKILKASGQTPPEVKRILELNLKHPVMEKIRTVFEKDPNDPALKDYSALLMDLAVIGEGGKVEDASGFNRIVESLMASALGG